MVQNAHCLPQFDQLLIGVSLEYGGRIDRVCALLDH